MDGFHNALWQWDIFNQHLGKGDDRYANPQLPASPLEQGFTVQITAGGKTETRALDRGGFADIRFRGEYPTGKAVYKDAASPVTVSLVHAGPNSSIVKR